MSPASLRELSNGRDLAVLAMPCNILRYFILKTRLSMTFQPPAFSFPLLSSPSFSPACAPSPFCPLCPSASSLDPYRPLWLSLLLPNRWRAVEVKVKAADPDGLKRGHLPSLTTPCLSDVYRGPPAGMDQCQSFSSKEGNLLKHLLLLVSLCKTGNPPGRSALADKSDGKG